MQVIDQQQHGLWLLAQPQRRRVESGQPQLPRVVQQRADMRAGAEVQAQQLAEPVRTRDPDLRRQCGLQAAARQLHRIVVTQPGLGGQQLPPEAEGLGLCQRRAARMQQAQGCAMRRQGTFELMSQAALADAGVADDQTAPQSGAREPALERVVQDLQFCSAADQRRSPGAAVHRRAGRAGAQHQPAGHRVVDTLDLQPLQRPDLEAAPHQAVGRLADAQATRRRGLLHARRDMHGMPHRRAVGVVAHAKDHLAGVQAQADRETLDAQRLLQVAAVGTRRQQDLQPRLHCALGVVLARAFAAECRLQAIAGVAQHAAPGTLDQCREALQRCVQQLQGILGVQRLQHGGRADDVAEQHRDLAQPRRLTRLGPDFFLRRRAQGARMGLDGGQGEVDHRIAQTGAL